MGISRKLRDQVWKRAKSCCEYCHMPQAYSPSVLEIDHVIPDKLRGPSTVANLALACFHCNNNKGPNIAGIDPTTQECAFLFSPRKDTWNEHFVWIGARLVGLTPSARATVELLQINRHDRVVVRESLINEGVFPPGELRQT